MRSSPIRHVVWPAILTGALLLALAGPQLGLGLFEETSSATSTGGFSDEVASPDVQRPVDFAFAPDGRVFVASKTGAVHIIKDDEVLSTPFITLPVNTYWDRGLQGIALDPDFDSNGYVYLYYTLENSPANFTGPKTGQLIRVTADGDVADPDSTLVLLGTEPGNPSTPSCENYPVGTDCLVADGVSHVGGGLAFAADGSLLLSTGDGAIRPGSIPVDLAWRAQELDSLAGKLLRIDPATGAGFDDNPFFNGDVTANRSKVWSYGFRNPFRTAVDPVTDTWLVGDVGSQFWEEINLAGRGADYGWPCYEGNVRHPTQQTFADCQSMYVSGPPNAHPFYTYVGPGGTMIAGAFHHGSNYPTDFNGAFFYGDYVRKTISVLLADADTGVLMPESAQQFMSVSAPAVAFKAGPDGDIYYMAWDVTQEYGRLRHIRFVEGNSAPVAEASAAPRGGLSPLAVQFSSDGSSDGDGDDLSYAWNFGDGTISYEPNPLHTFQQSGVYQTQLTVTDPKGASDAATLPVIVGNEVPIATIASPLPDSAFNGGENVAFSGSGYDPETGALAASRLHWTATLHHCYVATLGCHSHPYLNRTGSSGTLVAPYQEVAGELIYLELRLTVTDSEGLSDMASVELGPDSDGDGLLDHTEVLISGTDPLSADTDSDSCSDPAELGENEGTGGKRSPTNPWDYFNPSGDGLNRIDDVLIVIGKYFADDNDADPGLPPYAPGYDPHADRSDDPASPEGWDLLGPNGKQRIDDIVAIIKQYAHDCSSAAT